MPSSDDQVVFNLKELIEAINVHENKIISITGPSNRYFDKPYTAVFPTSLDASASDQMLVDRITLYIQTTVCQQHEMSDLQYKIQIRPTR
jgi:hypothetical protein